MCFTSVSPNVCLVAVVIFVLLPTYCTYVGTCMTKSSINAWWRTPFPVRALSAHLCMNLCSLLEVEYRGQTFPRSEVSGLRWCFLLRHVRQWRRKFQQGWHLPLFHYSSPRPRAPSLLWQTPNRNSLIWALRSVRAHLWSHSHRPSAPSRDWLGVLPVRSWLHLLWACDSGDKPQTMQEFSCWNCFRFRLAKLTMTWPECLRLFLMQISISFWKVIASSCVVLLTTRSLDYPNWVMVSGERRCLRTSI